MSPPFDRFRSLTYVDWRVWNRDLVQPVDNHSWWYSFRSFCVFRPSTGRQREGLIVPVTSRRRSENDVLQDSLGQSRAVNDSGTLHRQRMFDGAFSHFPRNISCLAPTMNRAAPVGAAVWDCPHTAFGTTRNRGLGIGDVSRKRTPFFRLFRDISRPSWPNSMRTTDEYHSSWSGNFEHFSVAAFQHTVSSASAAPTAAPMSRSPFPAAVAVSVRAAAVAGWATSPHTGSTTCCLMRPTASGC